MFINRRGATLYELLLVLTLLGVFASIAAPSLQSSRDALTVRAAREAVFVLFARARVQALQQGGAEIVLYASADRIQLRNLKGVVSDELLLAPRHVDLIVEGADPVVLRYDGHGLGRMMSRTINLRSRDAVAGLTISTFGRVRRW